MEDEPKPEDQSAANNQSVLEVHKATVKQLVDKVITELFFRILVRALASLAWYLSAFVLAQKDYRTAVLFPLVISEGSIVLFILLFSKPKNKRFLPTFIDLTRMVESGLIITSCFERKYSGYYIVAYCILALVSWKLLFSSFLRAVNETFSIRTVVTLNAGTLFC